MRARRIAGVLAAAALVVAAWGPVLARVGGGGGFSGGGGEGGGGGGALLFGLIRLLLWLVFREPIIGIPLLIIVIVVAARMARSGGLRLDVGENPSVLSGPTWRPAALARGPVDLAPVRSTDPFFSEPLFVDFAQLVYARAQELRGSGRREPLAVWMASPAIDALFAGREGLTAVDEVIFGATKIVQAVSDAGYVLLDVAFQTNLTETRGGSRGQMLCDERWTFRRKAGVHSPGPQRMRALGCPGCGATAEPKSDGTCPNCGAPRRGGLAQWEVSAIGYSRRSPLSPPELPSGGGVETGTDLPTVYDPRLPAMQRSFQGKHPEHDWAAFDAKLKETFLALQRAWTTQEWEKARPLETDALFQTHRFWLERYRAFGLVNHVEDVAVDRTLLVKLDADAFYEAATLRIFARARDWTEDAQGKVVSGNRSAPTIFSEYWTLLRAIPGSGAERPRSCPACAAPLDAAGQIAVCPYCGSKLDLGAFDWIVSRIEQDDAYAG